MFAANFSSPSATSSSARTRRTRESLAPSPAGRTLRMAGLAALLSLVGPGALSAQALGTMQVSARVVPAAVAWAGVAEAKAAVRAAAHESGGTGLVRRASLVRRAGLVWARAELPAPGSGDPLVVTVHHPFN